MNRKSTVFAAFFLVCAACRAESVSNGVIRLDPFTVIGSESALQDVPGSGAYISSESLKLTSYADVNRALREVPGVYLREEDGYGLFPNISLRGVDPGRSGKVTIMEDGVLSAPAPYSAPGAYYSPTAGRMHGIEVLKGSSQVRYGPHITGGVVNYLSTPIPDARKFYAKGLYGTDEEIRLHLHGGETLDTGAGRIGLLGEVFHHESDGFKRIDFFPGEDTGFEKTDWMVKLGWEPKTAGYQRFEFKFGYTDLLSHETYTSTAEADFRADPFRRYATTRFAFIDSEHMRMYLRHLVDFGDRFQLKTTVFNNEFERNWFKDREDGRDLANPARVAVLRGDVGGSVKYRNNNREYYNRGIESELTYDGDVHQLEAGVRLHADRIRRFQRDDTFTFAPGGVLLSRDNGVPGGGGNREQETGTLAGYVQDGILLRKGTTLTPGVRVEYLDQEFTEFNTEGDPGRVEAKGDGDLTVWAAGIGLVHELDGENSLFGGVYRGFSTPDPRSNIKNGIEEETSLSVEAGLRHGREAFKAEAALWFTDFSDLIVPDNVGTSGLEGRTENAGDIISYGAELSAAYDPARARDWTFSNPWHLTATLTRAELDGGARSSDTESIFSGGRDGNDVPYVPEVQASFGTGIETDRLGIFIDANFVDSAFTTASNTSQQLEPDGTPNANFGKTDSRVVVDLSAYYRIGDNVKLIGNVHNLFDEEYIVSRHPTGPRPGKPFTALVGVEVEF